MEFDADLSGEEINSLRFQTYNHEQSLSDRTFEADFLRKDTERTADIAEIYHENTKANKETVEKLQQTSAAIKDKLPGILTRIDPDYTDRNPVELPEPEKLSAPIGDVLRNRRSVFGFEQRPVSLRTLSTVLYYGVSQNEAQSFRRMYPSPGGLYPTELFVCLFNVDGCEPGVYFYNHRSHRLRQLRTESADTLLKEYLDCVYEDGIRPDLQNVPLVFLMAADFWRAKFKYGPRGYRYTLQESGHIAQNLLLALTASELGGRPLAAFNDDKLNDFVQLDGMNTATTYMLCAGHADHEGGDNA